MRTTRRQPPLVNLFRVLLREVADTADALSRSAGYECSGREMMPGAEARAYAVTLHGATVSASLFPLLGTAPHLGRFFTEEARPDAERVAVLNYRTWMQCFRSDAGVVDTVICSSSSVNGNPRSRRLSANLATFLDPRQEDACERRADVSPDAARRSARRSSHGAPERSTRPGPRRAASPNPR